jgi:hypothetical protein
MLQLVSWGLQVINGLALAKQEEGLHASESAPSKISVMLLPLGVSLPLALDLQVTTLLDGETSTQGMQLTHHRG